MGLGELKSLHYNRSQALITRFPRTLKRFTANNFKGYEFGWKLNFIQRFLNFLEKRYNHLKNTFLVKNSKVI